LLDGCGAAVTALSPGPLGLSGYVSERIACSRSPRVAAAQLRGVLAERTFDWVVVADEMLLQALLEDRDFARPAPWLPVDQSDANAVRLVLSKHAFVERAPELGIRIPESRLAATTFEAMLAAERIGYPVVLKGDHGFGGSEVRVCEDAGSLVAGSHELFASNSRLVVQQRIDGARTSACVLYDRGTVLACKAYRAECCHPDAHSASTVHEFFEHDAIPAIAAALGKATGFHGMAGIDFLGDGDGTLYALELNPRPTIGFAGTAANRAFFAPAVRRLLHGDAATAAAPASAPGERAKQTQSYFPGYIIYFASNRTDRGPVAWRRFFASLREARIVDGALAAWELARFMYDDFKRRMPGLHATAERARGLQRTPLHAVRNVDGARSAR
jgi:hypothetical protein